MGPRGNEAGARDAGAPHAAAAPDAAWTNRIPLEDEAAASEALAACIRDPDRELVDVPGDSFAFAESFPGAFPARR